jgi:putative Mg2+ transporter-C (MgtC) family protein
VGGVEPAVQAEMLARLVVATLLGALVGYERQGHGRPAGVRTHLIVALASATFMLVSTHFVHFQHFPPGVLVNADPSRIASSIVTGVGFLGGGAILRSGVNVQGLTTAAGLWLVAATGMAAGSGMYLLSASATALGMLALGLLRRLERRDERAPRRTITIETGPSAPPAARVVEALAEAGLHATPADYERVVDEQRVRLVLHAHCAEPELERMIARLEAQPGVRRVRVETAG